MTYKHTDFNDSIIGRELAKIAIEKGLATPDEPVKFKKVAEAYKEASALKPTDNFDENILKLCNGLRAQGFDKYATSIEVKFLQYKQADAANSLYDVSGETGEDLVGSAHPDGSHKMENMDGDCTIETILDRHKMMEHTVMKHPTGKLAAKDALNIARIILAQDSGLDDAKISQDKADINTKVLNAYNKINKALTTMSQVASTALHYDPLTPNAHPWLTTLLEVMPGGQIPGLLLSFFAKYSDSIKDKQVRLKGAYGDYQKESSYEHLQSIISAADDAAEIVKNMPDDAQTVKTSVQTNIDNGIAELNAAAAKWGTIGATQTTAPQGTTQATFTPQQQAAIKQTDDLVAKIKLSTKMDEDTKEKLITWLSPYRGALNDATTAPTAASKIDAAEKKWTAEGMI